MILIFNPNLSKFAERLENTKNIYFNYFVKVYKKVYNFA